MGNTRLLLLGMIAVTGIIDGVSFSRTWRVFAANISKYIVLLRSRRAGTGTPVHLFCSMLTPELSIQLRSCIGKVCLPIRSKRRGRRSRPSLLAGPILRGHGSIAPRLLSSRTNAPKREATKATTAVMVNGLNRFGVVVLDAVMAFYSTCDRTSQRFFLGSPTSAFTSSAWLRSTECVLTKDREARPIIRTVS